MLLFVFSARDIKVRYTQTFLGFFWIILSPLITVGVFTFVFGLMIKVPTDGLPYLMFYLVAIVPWYAFISTLNLTMGSIEGNAGLITKIYFPRLLLGGSYALSSALDYIVGYGVILIFAAGFGLLHIQLLIIMPFLFIIQTLFALGLGLLLAPLSTRYRDIKFFVPLAIQLYYFANPILYSISAAPHWVRPWYELNPMSTVITSYRSALMGHWPSWENIVFGVISAIVIFIIGVQIFRKNDQSLVDSL
jgi:lipopolysaccharide transport system permease protein